MKLKHILALAASLALALAVARPAAAAPAPSADVRIVSDVTVESRGRVARRTVTISYHENKLRVELGPDIVLLYDLEARRVFHLDLARKTYRITNLGDTAPNSAVERLRMGQKRSVRVKLEDSDHTRTIAGLPARKQVVVAQVRDDGNTMQGSNPVGGVSFKSSRGTYGIGIPLGADPRDEEGPDERKKNRKPVAIDIQAEYWMSDAVPLGTIPTAAFPCVALTLPNGNLPMALLEPMWTKVLATGRTFPLSSHVVVTPVPDDAGKPVVVKTEVQSIATTTLDRLLFCVPSDFTLEVDAVPGRQ